MKYINIVLSVFCLLFVCVVGSADTGGIGSLWDGLSLMLVLLPSYLLTAGAFNSYNFFSDKKSVLLFGDLAFGFGIIGTCLGIMFTLAGMALPPAPGVDPTAAVISNLAISTITLLYGLLLKYFVALPLAHSIKVK
tara:strand:+ start:491 stop:898 length:408 start_codon:yes stop_codon:yes gene_type:complete